MDDIFIGVSSTGSVICNVYKYFQQETTLDGVTRNYGDVFYTIDTTNKVVDFYILLGQYSTANFTPYTKIGATTTTGITQYSGTPTYYSSGTKNWATGNSTTYARKNDIPTDYAQITFGYDISPTQDSGGLVSSGGVYSALLNKANSNLSNVTYPANTIGSTTSGSGDRVIQTYIQTDLHLMYRIWQSGFKEVFGNGSIGETSKITRSLGVSFTSTSTMYIVVSNASGKTSGNTEGVMTGSPKSASEIYISSGYLDPNTSSYHFYVFGF